VQDVETPWLAQALQGDAQAFSQLVENYQTPVYNLCHRMLGDSYEAEDAAQETFLRAYKGLRRYDQTRPFSTWLLAIAAHHCIDQIRRRRMRLIPFDDLPHEELPDPAPRPEASVLGREEERRVRNLLETLSPPDRAAVVMLYWYDLSYEEIAEALNLTVSAVKSRLHRARREMAEVWAKTSSPTIVVAETRHAERTCYGSPAF